LQGALAESHASGNRRGNTGISNTDDEQATHLRGLLCGAVASMIRTCLNHSDAARIQWQGSAQKYRERWAQGDIDAIAPVLSDVLAWLRRSGIDPTLNTEVRALFNDPMFANITRRIPSGEAHSKLLEMFRQLASTREN
jgi:RNA polymerase-interacting CarD/CdnL/TRCF family regulator